MTGTEDKAALTGLLAAAISYCEREIASMNGSIPFLEKGRRQRIRSAYGVGEHWRGLATDDFIRMVDALIVLTR